MIFVNGEAITPTKFPDRTTQVWKLSDRIMKSRFVKVLWDFESEDEFLHLAQLKTLLDHGGVDCILYMSYLPYARQDKECLNDQTFALHSFATLLNSLNFKRVEALDPHSPVPIKVINNFVSLFPTKAIENAVMEFKPTMVVFPDEGARKRYSDFFVGLPTAHAVKIRDREGVIIRMTFSGVVEHEDVLIVDDICDGGATFVRLAAELQVSGVKSIALYVTHGIFSKGLRPLRDAGIKRIFTKDGEIVALKNNLFGQQTGLIPWGKTTHESNVTC